MRKLIFLFLFLPLFAEAITPVFCCGWECGAHWTITNTASYSTSTVRSGARSCRVNPTGTNSYMFQSAGVTSANTLVLRFYIRFATLPTGSSTLFTAERVGNVHFGLGYNGTSNKFAPVDLSSTGILTGQGVTLTTDVWYKIDMRVQNSANPMTIDIRVDGVAFTQTTVVATASTFLNIYAGNFFSGGNGDIFFDDLLMSNTSADYPITGTGGFVYPYVPTADGTHSGLSAGAYRRTLTTTDILNATTDAYQLIDDVPMESGTGTDWINMITPAASSYTEHIFGAAPGIVNPTFAPRTVEVIAGIHQAAVQTGTMQLLLNDNGTTGSIYLGSVVAGVTTIAYKRAHFFDPPSAATVWTTSGNGNFNNIRVRFAATATVDANPDQYLDCIMIEAEFDEPAPKARRSLIISKNNKYEKVDHTNGNRIANIRSITKCP